MNYRKTSLLITMLVFSLTLSACGSKVEPEVAAENLVKVKVQKASDSKNIIQELNYPGLIYSEGEAKIIAKTSGTIADFNIKTGELVKSGQELGKINDVSAVKSASVFNASQIKQAQIAVAQAESSYQLARTNYNNLLVSSVNDLKSAEIARDQAVKGEYNLASTTSENLKSAELAYETAKTATEQARLSLENKKKLFSQSSIDVTENTGTVIDLAYSSAGSLILNINNILGLDDNGSVNISYRNNLGATNSSSYDQAKDTYIEAKSRYQDFNNQSFKDNGNKLEAILVLLEKVKLMIDSSKNLLENSISSSDLPQSSATGVSLSGLQQSVAAYQTQINGLLSQAKTAKQALVNVDLNNNSSLDSLEKSYQLAIQQEALAAQNLNNLKAGNTSQTDQAGFSVDLAKNQYENLKIKSNSQIAVARSQMDNAQLQYNNAQVALQNLFDIHSLISPISGSLTRKLVNNGDTVSAGQLLASVSQTDNLKVQFFIDAERLNDIIPGSKVLVEVGDNKYEAVIFSVAQQADPVSRRFLVEASLADNNLIIGTVVNVKIAIKYEVASNNSIILPLSAINIGQNESTIFIEDNGVAKKESVEVLNVSGELITVKANLQAETNIIIEGNKLLQDGQKVLILAQ